MQNPIPDVKKKHINAFFKQIAKKISEWKDKGYILPICLLLFSALVLIFEVILLRNPQLIYTYIHWVWILVLGIVIFIVLFVFGIIFAVKASNYDLPPQFSLIQILLAVCILPLMILGLTMADKTTYQISSTSDLRLLGNLPKDTKNNYFIELTNDIDFSGKTVKDHYGNGSNYVIDGNGYALKNIDYSLVIEEDIDGFSNQASWKFFYTTSGSTIKNLSLTNCSFHIRPEAYDDDRYTPLTCNFLLFPSSVILQSVNVDATIYVEKSQGNFYTNHLATVETIYPSSKEDAPEGCTFNVIVIREN